MYILISWVHFIWVLLPSIGRKSKRKNKYQEGQNFTNRKLKKLGLGGWMAHQVQARWVSRRKLCAGKPWNSPPTPAAAHPFNSPHPPYTECTGIAHRWRMPPGWPLCHCSGCPHCLQAWVGRSPALWNSDLQPSGHSLSLHKWVAANQIHLCCSGTFLARVWFSYFCLIYVKCHSFLPKEITVHLTLSSFEIINIWLIMCWSSQSHVSSCSKELAIEFSFAADVVYLRAQVWLLKRTTTTCSSSKDTNVPSKGLFKQPASANLCHPNGGCRFQALISWRIV